jgi:hypothetical protein
MKRSGGFKPGQVLPRKRPLSAERWCKYPAEFKFDGKGSLITFHSYDTFHFCYCRRYIDYCDDCLALACSKDGGRKIVSPFSFRSRDLSLELVESFRTSDMISRLIRVIWQSALPPTICVVANAVTLELRSLQNTYAHFRLL